MKYPGYVFNQLCLDIIFIILEKRKRSIRERVLGNLIFRAAQNRWLRTRAPENYIFVKSYLSFFNLKQLPTFNISYDCFLPLLIVNFFRNLLYIHQLHVYFLQTLLAGTKLLTLYFHLSHYMLLTDDTCTRETKKNSDEIYSR